MGSSQVVYVLKGDSEFERLEHQSSLGMMSPERDLKDIRLERSQRFLDAGCGSGLSSRYLATNFPYSSGTGCDASDIILAKAKNAAKHLSNIQFQKEDIRDLSFESENFDLILCRYVLHHLSPQDRLKFAKSAKRCLKAQGKIRLIDIDGIFLNLYPETPFLAEAFHALETKGSVDMRVGRKLVSLLVEAGFSKVDWRVDTLEFKGDLKKEEKKMAAERIDSAIDYYIKVLGSKEKAYRFKEDFCSALDRPETVCFYSKFIVTGEK